MFLNQLINDLLFVKPKSNPKASPSTLHHQEKANFFKRTNYWCTWSCISRDTCQRTCTDTNPLLGLGRVPFCRFHTYSKKKKKWRPDLISIKNRHLRSKFAPRILPSIVTKLKSSQTGGSWVRRRQWVFPTSWTANPIFKHGAFPPGRRWPDPEDVKTLAEVPAVCKAAGSTASRPPASPGWSQEHLLFITEF